MRNAPIARGPFVPSSFRRSVWIGGPATFQVNPSPDGHLPTQRTSPPPPSRVRAAGLPWLTPGAPLGVWVVLRPTGGAGAGPPGLCGVSELRSAAEAEGVWNAGGREAGPRGAGSQGTKPASATGQGRSNSKRPGLRSSLLLSL